MEAIYNDMEDRIEELEVVLNDAVALLRFCLDHDTTSREVDRMLHKAADALSAIAKNEADIHHPMWIDSTLAKIAELKDSA